MISFPNNPAVGDVYEENNRRFEFDGIGWRALALSANDVCNIVRKNELSKKSWTFSAEDGQTEFVLPTAAAVGTIELHINGMPVSQTDFLHDPDDFTRVTVNTGSLTAGTSVRFTWLDAETDCECDGAGGGVLVIGGEVPLALELPYPSSKYYQTVVQVEGQEKYVYLGGGGSTKRVHFVVNTEYVTSKFTTLDSNGDEVVDDEALASYLSNISDIAGDGSQYYSLDTGVNVAGTEKSFDFTTLAGDTAFGVGVEDPDSAGSFIGAWMSEDYYFWMRIPYDVGDVGYSDDFLDIWQTPDMAKLILTDTDNQIWIYGNKTFSSVAYTPSLADSSIEIVPPTSAATYVRTPIAPAFNIYSESGHMYGSSTDVELLADGDVYRKSANTLSIPIYDLDLSISEGGNTDIQITT
jgi:hypothetical protein